MPRGRFFIKILVFSQYYYPEPFRIHEICEGLVSRGHQITVVTTFPNYPEGEIYAGYENEKKRIEFINGVEIIRYKTIPRHKGLKYLALNYISYATKITSKLKELKSRGFDIVFAYQLSPVTMVIPAIIYKKKNSIPMYLYCLDIWPESIKEYIPNEKNLFYRIIKLFSSKIYQCADLIGITSGAFRGYLIKTCGVDNDKICFLPQHADDIGECQRTEDDDITTFYFTGNIGETQNVDIIINAVDKIRYLQNFTVNFVGSGSNLDYAINKVKEYNLEDKIIFHGRYPASEMTKFYKKADACLLTLSNSTFTGLTIPGKMQGYMAAGKTIIAAIDGDAADIITKSKSGIAVSANDLDGFAYNLKRFILNKNKYKKCGYNARKYYEKNFTLETYLEGTINNLYELLKD